MECKLPLVYLGQQMDTELPLGIGMETKLPPVLAFQSQWLNSDPALADGQRTATVPCPVGDDHRTQFRCIDHWFQMTLSSEDTWKPKQPLNPLVWQMETKLPPVLAFQSQWLNSDPALADGQRTATVPCPVGDDHRTQFRCIDHWFQMTLSSEDTWKPKQPLNPLVWQMETKLPPVLAFQSQWLNSDPALADGQRTATVPCPVGDDHRTQFRCIDHWFQMTLSSEDTWKPKQPLNPLVWQMETKLPPVLAFQSQWLNSDPALADGQRTATVPCPVGDDHRTQFRCIDHWFQMTLSSEDTWKPKQPLNPLVWQMETKLPPVLAFQSQWLNSDPALADGQRTATVPCPVGDDHRTQFRCIDHWFQMTLSSEDTWKPKQPLNPLVWQMETKLPPVLAFQSQWLNSDPALADGQRTATVPCPVGDDHRTQFRCIDHWFQMTLSSEDTWKPKQPLNPLVWQMETKLPPVLAFQSLLLNSDPELADRHRTATGPWCVIDCRRTRIMRSDHRCQMNLSTNDEWNWKYNLAYLGQQRTQNCHGTWHKGTIAELGSGTQITGVRVL
ncbi:hypothetical protein NN561_019924 [Cricetulus griseus]